MTERIACAAVRRHGVIYKVARPGRHHNVVRMMHYVGLRQDASYVQGFVTNTGRFVDRKEACGIAKAAGQIRVKTGGPDDLYSEDVW